MARLDRLLRPESIAVFGGREARAVVRQCDVMGFAGEIWPVHPNLREIEGRSCYRSVAELPRAPDAAFVGVNRHASVDIVRDLASAGAGGAIAYASGFREAGRSEKEGPLLEATLLEAAGAMPLVGPNCYGFINYLDGALLWPDQHGGARVARGVAIVTQSSNIAINMTMQRRALPVAYVVTVGNQAQIDLAGIVLGLLDDPRVTAIGLHVEGIGDVARFEEMALRARRLGKPVVAITVGRSPEARAATVSHTASMTASDAAEAALFQRLGVPRLASIPAFLETLKLLHVHGPLAGRDIASMSCSGGEAALIADAAVARRLRFRPFDETGRTRLRATLNAFVDLANPLDYHTFIWADEAAMTATFGAVLGCGFDLSMLVLDFPRLDRCSDADWEVAVAALRGAINETKAVAAIVSTLPENLTEVRAAALMQCGIAPLAGLDDALLAAEAAADIGAAWARDEPLALIVPKAPGTAPARVLSEAEAKRRLHRAGVGVPKGAVARGPEKAAEAAKAIGMPVALKITGVNHKSETGGVRLSLASPEAVRDAADGMGGPQAEFLVEEMVADPVAELVVAITRDPLGFLLTVGAGGVLVELIADTRSLLLPVTREEMRGALLSLKAAPLLQGHRGRPKVDIEAALDAMAAIVTCVEADHDGLEEIEINPLILRAEGRGAVAADALIRTRRERE